MSTRIGISGFGAVGRRVLRILSTEPGDLEVAALNGTQDNRTNAHLFRFDTTYGTFSGDVGFDDEALLIDGKRVQTFREKDPKAIPWKEVGVDIVLECTGKFKTREGAAQHLQGGARKVIISAPGTDEDLTVVYGVNHAAYDPKKHDVISNGSCTTNCLVPLVKVLDDAFGFEKGLFTTVHSYTKDQSLLDGSHKDLRRARAAAENIIPTSSGASKTIARIFPHLTGKVTGLALRVPTPAVSILDLTADLKATPSAEAVNHAFRSAAAGPMGAILQVTDDLVVSSDLKASPYSATLDASLTAAMGHTVKILAWYDNEWGYAQRMVDITRHVAANL